MGEDSPVPVFTGAELALADALILLMKVMAMHGIIKPEAVDVVFSDLETSYRIEAYAPVYVSAAPPAHVADTKDNYPQQRRDRVIRFLRTGNVAIPRRFHADWIVVADRRFDLELDLPKAYEDSRFTLYRVN